MRVTTTLDDRLAKQAQQKARSLNESMSAFVSEAVRLRLEQLEWTEAVEQLNDLVGDDFVKDDYQQAIRDMRDA